MSLDSQYNEVLEFMFAQLPMFSRTGAAAYKADLNNIIALCGAIGNPHLKFKSIHVGGTNGKGSCSHMLASILHEAGYKTGLYTSPHIADFRERIRIDGNMIAKQYVVNFIEKIKPSIEQLEPSFFEITVALAFDYFAKEAVDIAIVEVGLGGLLDSTNIITPEVSLITNISLDHTNLLGTSLKEIASQKAGIIKENIPVVISETQAEVESVFFTKSIFAKSPIFYADQIFELIQKKNTDHTLWLRYLKPSNQQFIEIETDLLGEYQVNNVRAVLTVSEIMKSLGWKITNNHIQKALGNVKKTTGLIGRFDLIKSNASWVLDVSHNKAGLTQVFKQIKKMHYNKLWVILAFVKDKEVADVMKLLPTEAQYIATQAHIERALPFESLNELCKSNALSCMGMSRVTEALDFVNKNAAHNDLILITGSFFIMEEAYNWINTHIKKQ